MKRLDGIKAIYFVGPVHHQRLVYPVIEALEKEGMKTLYITCNQEPPFERFCVDRNIPFKFEYEYLDENYDKILNEHFKSISQDFMKRYYSIQESTFWPLSIATKILRWTVETYYLYERILELEKPDFVIYQNEMNMWSEILGHLAYAKGIPAVSFHEGSYYQDMFVFRLHNSYSINLLWGQSVADVIIRSGANPYRLIFTGNTHLDSIANSFDEKHKRKIIEETGIYKDRKTVMIIVSYMDVPSGLPEKVNLILKAFQKLGNFNFLIKHHPLANSEIVNAFASQIVDNNHKVKNIHFEEAYPYLAISDLAITTGRSTLVLEAIALGVPVVDISPFLGHDSYYRDILPIANKEEELLELSKTFLEGGISSYIDEKKKSALESEFGSFKGAVRRAKEFIKQLIDIHRNYKELYRERLDKIKIYKKEDVVVLSQFELEECHVKTIVNAVKKQSNCSNKIYAPFINGHPMGIIYDISSRPVLSKEKPQSAVGILAIIENDFKKKFDGFVDYDLPSLIIMDLVNRLVYMGMEVKMLDVNILLNVEPLDILPCVIPKPEDVIKFYINNLLFLNKEVYNEVETY